MAKITITIDGDNVTVNQSADPTKVEQENKKFFIIIREDKDDKTSEVDFVTDDRIAAVNKIRGYGYDSEYIYRLYVQNENGAILPCSWTDCD